MDQVCQTHRWRAACFITDHQFDMLEWMNVRWWTQDWGDALRLAGLPLGHSLETAE